MLAHLIDDCDLRQALRRGARKVYEQTFTMCSFEEKLHDALELRRVNAAICGTRALQLSAPPTNLTGCVLQQVR